MSTTIPRDYEALRAELYARIPLLTDRWTDTNASDLGAVLVELLSFTADTLHYYLDAQLAEAFLSSARSRDSVFRLARQLAYQPRVATPSRAVLRFRIPSGTYGEDLEIPAGCVCRAGSIEFLTVEDAVLTAGATYVDVEAQQGSAASVTYSGTGRRTRFSITTSTLAHDSIAVQVAGETWQRVNHFLDSGLTDKHYMVEVGADNVHTVVFGRLGHGATPSGSTPIVISYLDTLGAAGNVGAGKIVSLVGPIYGTVLTRHVLTNTILQVTNPVQSVGGADPETTERVRAMAPGYFSTQDRCVITQDYGAVVSTMPGVSRVAALDSNDCANLHYRHVAVVVEPSGGGYMTPEMRQAVEALLYSKRPAGIEVRLYDPSYVELAIEADLYVARGTSAYGTVRASAEAALLAWYGALQFGQAVNRADIISALTVEGVGSVSLASPAQDITLTTTQLPSAPTITLRLHGTEAA